MESNAKYVAKWSAVIGGILVGITALIVVFVLGIGAMSRYQNLAGARNTVKISTVEIQNQKQRVIVAKQKAEIRLQDAIGVREAQDEIAKTLTPLYVQFEMVDALRQIAQSGKNSSVVYIPAGANGIPLVANANGPSVGVPESR